MPVPTILPLPVEKTDNFDQWRQKTNIAFQAIFDLVNGNDIETWIELTPPINNRDMLLFNSSTQTFQNILFDIAVQDYLDDNGYQPASKVKNYYMANLHNLY
jgi:hypothetical protein